jgi:hypothetical protein
MTNGPQAFLNKHQSSLSSADMAALSELLQGGVEPTAPTIGARFLNALLVPPDVRQGMAMDPRTPRESLLMARLFDEIFPEGGSGTQRFMSRLGDIFSPRSSMPQGSGFIDPPIGGGPRLSILDVLGLR